MESFGCPGKTFRYIFVRFMCAGFIPLRCGILFEGNGGVILLGVAKIITAGI